MSYLYPLFVYSVAITPPPPQKKAPLQNNREKIQSVLRVNLFERFQWSPLSFKESAGEHESIKLFCIIQIASCALTDRTRYMVTVQPEHCHAYWTFCIFSSHDWQNSNSFQIYHRHSPYLNMISRHSLSPWRCFRRFVKIEDSLPFLRNPPLDHLDPSRTEFI